MFGQLTEKFEQIVSSIRGYSRLSDKNVRDALKQVRAALLEADVNYKVVKEFISQTEEKAVGQLTTKGVMPGQQFVKLVYDELVDLLGGKAEALQFREPAPMVIVLAGLQGSGKTTTTGKLAKYFGQKGKKSFLIAADVYRPAAVEQLKILGKQLNLPVFHQKKRNPVEICENGVEQAKREAYDVVLIDTAGRLHLDQALMQELLRIKQKVSPSEVLLVADAMTGQDAVNLAKEFNQQVGLTGVVLTKMDGDTRGGAALSIHWVSGRPIRFVGVGEKLQALEPFFPDRMASRILGMGDVVSLVEKAQKAVEEKETISIQERIRKESFTFDDFYQQLQQIKKMGSLESLLSLVPGLGGRALKGANLDEKALVRVEAMINSMTKAEKANPHVINGSRRRRIASGSGNSIQDVNKLMKQFEMMQKMVKGMSKLDPKQMSKIFSPN